MSCMDLKSQVDIDGIIILHIILMRKNLKVSIKSKMINGFLISKVTTNYILTLILNIMV